MDYCLVGERAPIIATSCLGCESSQLREWTPYNIGIYNYQSVLRIKVVFLVFQDIQSNSRK